MQMQVVLIEARDERGVVKRFAVWKIYRYIGYGELEPFGFRIIQSTRTL